jgi:hypothetical protein
LSQETQGLFGWHSKYEREVKMEFQLGLGEDNTIHGSTIRLIELVECGVLIEVDKDEVTLIEGMRIAIRDPLRPDHGSFLWLTSTSNEKACFEVREKRSAKKMKNLARKIASNQIKKKSKRSMH